MCPAPLVYPIRAPSADWGPTRVVAPAGLARTARRFVSLGRPGGTVYLGHLGLNPKLRRLYADFVTDADAVTPGREGRLVQIIPNYDAPGRRAIVIAGGDIEETRELAEEIAGSE